MAQEHLAASVFAGRSELIDFYTRVDEPSHPGAVKLLGYWRDCIANGDGFVLGRDIPARPIASLLANVMVGEPLADWSDLRLRLIGAAVRREFDGASKDHFLSELFPAGHFTSYLKCIAQFHRIGQPVVFESRLGRSSSGRLRAEIVLMPVKSNDRTRDLLLAGLFYFD